MEAKSTEKKIERISKQQKQKLVDYMSANLEFARGQFGSLNSNISSKEQWESLRVSLNSLGGSEKTVEQWKKCWLDLKSGVKKTINARRKFMNKTGGGSWAEIPRDLNPLEEQILKIITIDAVDGDACTPESGITLVEQIEEYDSIEFLESEEVFTPPVKKQKTMVNTNLDFPSTSQASLKRKLPSTSKPKSALKYTDALEEARQMQNELVEQLKRIESQNKIILEKLDILLSSKRSENL